MDWWMDDWISHVYGMRRTRKGPHHVIHHVSSHATRYKVNFEHKVALAGEIAKGQQRVMAWTKTNRPDLRDVDLGNKSESTLIHPDVAASKACQKMQATHGVVVGTSWGSMTVEQQARWRSLGCDTALGGHGQRKETLDDALRKSMLPLRSSNNKRMPGLGLFEDPDTSTLASAGSPCSETVERDVLYTPADGSVTEIEGLLAVIDDVIDASGCRTLCRESLSVSDNGQAPAASPFIAANVPAKHGGACKSWTWVGNQRLADFGHCYLRSEFVDAGAGPGASHRRISLEGVFSGSLSKPGCGRSRALRDTHTMIARTSEVTEDMDSSLTDS
jgi:hypothetical protein